MNFFQKDSCSAIGLAACILGLVICPFLYIAIGALSGAQLLFIVVMLPPLLLGSGFLLWRFLSSPTDRPTSEAFILLELVSWFAVLIFTFFISNFTLLTSFERLGSFCALFMIASLCSLPLVFMRKTTLERRLAQLPKGLSWIILLIVLVLCGYIVMVYSLSEPVFI